MNNQSMHTTSDMPGKTVYILGAGFSMSAGAPSQAGILAGIFRLDDSDPAIKQAKQSLRTFLTDDLGINESQFGTVALEDIYTPIDRCVADGISLRSRTYVDLIALRDGIESLISHSISAAISRSLAETPGATRYIDTFARRLVKIASHRAVLARNTDSSAAAKGYDPLAVISLNWDILLDNALHKALSDDCELAGDYDPFGVVDYCCYISSLEATDKRVRAGLWTLGCRGYNVKLLKLHGSMNWLQCPNCQRLFVQFGGKQEIIAHIGKTLCRHCKKYGHANPLRGSLVMPTFLKDLNNFQIKLVWQNAGVELMEARRIVFVGYSLPHADFEFRQLLSRMVQKDAVIDVVLYRRNSEEGEQSYLAETERYQQFFGERTLRFHPEGAVGFVQSHTMTSV